MTVREDSDPPADSLNDLLREIQDHYLIDEQSCLEKLEDFLHLDYSHVKTVEVEALKLIEEIRGSQNIHLSVEAFLHEYTLNSQEGTALMCLAEALLRIPDREVALRLVRDKIHTANWEKHLGQSDSLFVNASTWALMLSGNVLKDENPKAKRLAEQLQQLTSKYTEPVILTALKQAMRLIGNQFVYGQSIATALKRASTETNQQIGHSFDMLGEAALTQADAQGQAQA